MMLINKLCKFLFLKVLWIIVLGFGLLGASYSAELSTSHSSNLTKLPSHEPSTSYSAEHPPFPAKMTITVYQPPSPLIANNKNYLIYEIYITNLMGNPLDLKKLQIKTPTKQFEFSDKNLSSLLKTSIPLPLTQSLSLQPGETKTIFMWLSFNANEAVPNHLVHVFSMDGVIHNKHYLFQEQYPLQIQKTLPFSIGPPVKGNNWLAGNAPSNQGAHRGEYFVFDGKPFYSQRYAIDFVQMGNDGLSYDGDRTKDQNYHAYNQDVLAVHDGKVVFIKDGIPENIPNSGKFAVDIDLKTLAGNYLILDLGNKKYAGYAHLIPGSFKVKQGDYVTKGQVIAKLGNSGNSTEPHLHFQIMDRPDFYFANGVPYVFDHFKMIPIKVIDNSAANFRIESSNRKVMPFNNQMVLENTFMNFSD